MMLVSLTTPSGSQSALPTVARTLPQAELLHRALLSKLGKGPRPEPCPELSGRDAAGNPLQGHQHAHLLPLDLDDDGRLDHILVWAPMNLAGSAQRAVRALSKTYMKGGVGELQVAVAGVGALDDLRALQGRVAQGVTSLLGPPGGACAWTSATPFVPPRYLKRSGRASLIGQVEEELASRGLPPAQVEVLPWGGETLALRHAVRVRQRGTPPPQDLGVALRLTFEQPVTGPISLGYGSHFGLGRFHALAPAAPGERAPEQQTRLA